jgi:hypothetical protein
MILVYIYYTCIWSETNNGTPMQITINNGLTNNHTCCFVSTNYLTLLLFDWCRWCCCKTCLQRPTREPYLRATSLHATSCHHQPHAYMQGVTTRSQAQPPQLPHNQHLSVPSDHICLIEVEHQIESDMVCRQYMYHKPLCKAMWTIHKASSVSTREREGNSCIVVNFECFFTSESCISLYKC